MTRAEPCRINGRSTTIESKRRRINAANFSRLETFFEFSRRKQLLPGPMLSKFRRLILTELKRYKRIGFNPRKLADATDVRRSAERTGVRRLIFRKYDLCAAVFAMENDGVFTVPQIALNQRGSEIHLLGGQKFFQALPRFAMLAVEHLRIGIENHIRSAGLAFNCFGIYSRFGTVRSFIIFRHILKIVEFLQNFLDIRAVDADSLPDCFAVSERATQAMHAVCHKNFRRLGIKLKRIENQSVLGYFF